eukprot:TRINITY_DN36490_c0_g1_i1.p1 TRINITY_DN36490_c0_g1~~TRINITY_DN36490_c0_g1_i1.p1  ORF type:complete len:693 (+),score=207.80 TRINITY_DN36490_c0_g1_i1:45-2081(+)
MPTTAVKGNAALARLADLPYTFAPGVQKHHRVSQLRELLGATAADDLCDFLRTGEPRGTCARLSRSELLALAAEWSLPPVRFGSAMPGAERTEAGASQQARVFAEAAVAMAPDGGLGAAKVLAEAALLCGDLRMCADSAAKLLRAKEAAQRLCGLRLLARAVSAGFEPDDAALPLWCDAVAAAAGTAGCDDAATVWRLALADAVRRAVSRAGLPAWRTAATPVGVTMLSSSVLHGGDGHLLAWREGAAEALQADPHSLPALRAAAALAHQGLLRGWILPDDSDDRHCAGDGFTSALTKAMYSPPTPCDLAALGAVPEVAEDSEERLPAHLKTPADVGEAVKVFSSWCSLVLHGPAPEEEPAKVKCTIAERTVQSFYDGNPYPVWRAVGTSGLPTFPSHSEYLRAFLPPAVARTLAGSGKRERILVAGCGSGHQVGLALDTYLDSLVTGIDLSRIALAYAKRMLESAEQWRGRWDLLLADLTQLDERSFPHPFDAVECCGVLHHCADPQSALAALVRTLRPGGVLTLGVYAASAAEGVRQSIEWVRERFRLPEGREPTLDECRSVREDVLALSPGHPVRRTLESHMAFAATAPLRDMLFHPCAHYFSVQDLKRVCDAAGLKLLAFQFNSYGHDVAARLAHSQVAPDDPDMRDWAVWQRLESDGKLRGLGPWHEVILQKQ